MWLTQTSNLNNPLSSLTPTLSVHVPEEWIQSYQGREVSLRPLQITLMRLRYVLKSARFVYFLML